MLTDEELKTIIDKNPASIIRRAYNLGKKDANLELVDSVKQNPNWLKEITGTMKDWEKEN